MKNRELEDLLESIEASSDDLINMALVPGGRCIKSDVLDHAERILSACNSLKKTFLKKTYSEFK